MKRVVAAKDPDVLPRLHFGCFEADRYRSEWLPPFLPMPEKIAHENVLALAVQELDVNARLLIAARLRSKYVEAGHDLCRQGEPATCLWLLEEGESL